jgi:CRP-like cAMP-binding protein
VPENADGSDRAAEINFTLDTLKSIPLFAQLTYQQLVRIMNLTRIVPFGASDVLCYEGDMAEELFVILRGEVQLTTAEEPIAIMRTGSHFGEMALIDATPRSATARALTDGKLLLINREDFYEILRKEAPLAVKLLWSFVQELSARLRQTNADLSIARHAEPEPEPAEILDFEEVSSESSGRLSSEALAAVLSEPSSDTVEIDPEELDAVDLDEAVTDPKLPYP